MKAPGRGGGFGPYRQSERKSQYEKYAMQLLKSGHAYYAFDTPGELDSMRKEYETRGETFVYDARVRDTLRNSLHMQPGEVEEMLASGTPYVIRFRFESNEEIVMEDMVRGEVVVNTSTLDDKILFKSDGMPTYHLANVVDDNLMAISHVIRGEEWLPSLPLHVALYRAFGWEHLMPKFAHLPLILKPTGKGKLSKRDGEKGGFPVFPLEWKDPQSGEFSPGYREEGYLPEGCINMLALLGWNPGTEQELFSLNELIKEFQLEKVGKSGSRFDPEKTKWFNHQHIQLMSDQELIPAFQSVLKARGVETDNQRLGLLVPIIKPRISFIHEVWEEVWFFFSPPTTYDPNVIKKRWKEDTPGKMEELVQVLEQCDPFTAESVETVVKDTINRKEWGMGAIMNAWRLVLVGAAKGPGLFDLAAFLGKGEVIERMKKGINEIQR